ncbi:MAG: sulfite exporter TauE/SafE family protein [Deltaproteobacteria bacterium]|nr:sulfite exporter TauE/SafE family protein [Deltaproteobacteria bacterium]
MEMQAAQIIALLITGIGVGFASGLLGVGGCFIMVPVQFWALKSIGVDPTIAIRIAFGTNLLVVLPTAFSGAMAHHKKGAVRWKAGVTFGIAGALGAFGGAFIASHLPGKVLTTAFGIAVILGAIRMLTAKPPKITDEPSDSLTAFILWGIPLGIVSGIIGIGGGVLMIPIMVYFLKFKMHQAVGTSTALMIFTALRRRALLLDQRAGRSGTAALFHRLSELVSVGHPGRGEHSLGRGGGQHRPPAAGQAAQVSFYHRHVLHGAEDVRGVRVAEFTDL